MSKVQAPGFSLVALRFVTDVSRTLKINDNHKLPSSRAPEPPPEVAWQYAKGNIPRVWCTFIYNVSDNLI